MAVWVYKDMKTTTRWVWVAQVEDLAPIYKAASGLLAGLIPTESAMVETLSAGLADQYHAQCSAPAVHKGALLRARARTRKTVDKAGRMIIWQELSMLDPPLKHKEPQAVVDWMHASLKEQFPGIHEPMAVEDSEVDPTNWAKSIIEPCLIRAHALSQAREIRLSTKEPVWPLAALPRL